MTPVRRVTPPFAPPDQGIKTILGGLSIRLNPARDPAANHILRYCADPAKRLTTSLDHDHRGDTHRTVVGGQTGILVNIHFHYFQCLRLVTRQGLRRWCNQAAGSTPGCPKLHQHRSIHLQDFTLEHRVVYG
jgi:hypothetical protein